MCAESGGAGEKEVRMRKDGDRKGRILRCRGYDRMLEKSGVRKRVEKRLKTDGAESEG